MTATKKDLQKMNDLQDKLDFTKKYADAFPCEAFLKTTIDRTLRVIIAMKQEARDFGFCPICDQLLRSATSVAANISEGRGRSTYGSLISFMSIARGSLFEVFEHLSFLKTIFNEISAATRYHSGEVIEYAQEMCRYLNRLEEDWSTVRELFAQDWEILLASCLAKSQVTQAQVTQAQVTQAQVTQAQESILHIEKP